MLLTQALPAPPTLEDKAGAQPAARPPPAGVQRACARGRDRLIQQANKASLFSGAR